MEQPPLLLLLSRQSGLKFNRPAAQAAGWVFLRRREVNRD